jgi:regulator of sigma E protease
MNLVLALLLFPVVFMIGTEVPSYLKKAPVLGNVEADSPGMEAGFKSGDTIVRIDGASINTWGELDNIVMTNPGNSMTVSFLREGVFMETTLTPSTNEAYGTGYAGLVHQIEPAIGGLNPGYPAERAGLKLGDRIVAIEGVPVYHWNQIPQLIAEHKDKEITFTVQRGEEEHTFLIKPKLEEVDGKTRHYIGISPLMETVIEQYGVFESLKKGTLKFGEMTVMTFYVLKRLVTRKLSMKTLGGPIMIAQITGQAAKSGISNLLLFMAFLSLNLGILNLLPIPVLDGGHIAFLFIEFLRGKPLGVKKMEIAQQIGLVLLILLMIVVTYNDIQRILPWNIGDFFSGK